MPDFRAKSATYHKTVMVEDGYMITYLDANRHKALQTPRRDMDRLWELGSIPEHSAGVSG
jgi:hypothetical protein